LARYRAQPERHRTTPSAVFGVKIIMSQLSWLTGGNMDAAAEILRSFDKVLLMRRRDTLRQAISLMRAMSTGQWHVIPGDELKPLTGLDASLTSARITYCWAQILGLERDMTQVAAALSPDKRRTVWYEDLSDQRTLGAISAWLSAETGAPPAPTAPDHPLPVPGDSREADAIMKAYLDYIGVLPP
jgi:LPS sulfotransferase NodH